MYIFNLTDKDVIEILKCFFLVWEWVIEVLNKLFILKTGKTIWIWLFSLIIVGIIFRLITSELNVSHDNKAGRFIYETLKNIFDWTINCFSKKN